MTDATFFCECDDERCDATLDITAVELQDVRGIYAAHDDYYVVVPGHDYGEPIVLEGVSMSGFRYLVVRGYPNLKREPKQQ